MRSTRSGSTSRVSGTTSSTRGSASSCACSSAGAQPGSTASSSRSRGRLPVPGRERHYRRDRRDRTARLRDQEDRQREDRVHRADARGYADIVTPSGVAGLKFHAGSPDDERARPEASATKQGVRAFVVLLHQGGFQNPPFPVFPGPRTAQRLCGRQPLRELRRSRDLRDRRRTLIRSRRDRQRPHTRAVHLPDFAGTGKLLTSASSFGRLITDIDLVIDHQTKDVKSATARNGSSRRQSPRIRR